MNSEDESLFAWDEQAYRAGVEREVNEEVIIGSSYSDRVVALLNDDSNEVGKVHLGIVHIYQLKEPSVQKREAVITNLAFLAPDELKERRDSLETWSQICADSLPRLLSS
jgi:predicted NUDIX family phosphoesterase